jgi:uncharacterized membrane protein YhaH (DUF805 family)
MQDALSAVSPLGRTSRGHYWLVVLGSALMLLALWSFKDIIGAAPGVVLILATQLVVLIATSRRLNDSAWSRWWLMLFLFPDEMTWDLFQVQIDRSTWHFIDLSASIRLIPVVIGLLAASQSRAPNDLRRADHSRQLTIRPLSTSSRR